ncbi:MAG: NAD-dependent epimerase/dehydratase family protein [Cyclobacteriaceae bacterium]|nr:NAD-dependent epimerase/dehydratase family protein [Cyclobacteriaceae bacterium]
MRVLITGGAGYIGTVLTKHLVKCPEVDKIIIYDNLSRKNSNLFMGERLPNAAKVELVVGDILDLRKLNKVLTGVDAVFHLAARVSTPFANVDADFHEQVNHWGTSELVSAVEMSEVKKFIYTSSTSVYGGSVATIGEHEIPDPKTFYGISKFRGEEHVRRLQKKCNALILRCANVYGYSRSMRFDAVINRFMFDANFLNRIQIHGNGQQSRAFIHVNVLVKSLIACLLEEVPSGIYNVVDKNLQILDIVDVLKNIYPSLEFIFINQHLTLRQMMVEPNSSLRKFVDYSNNLSLTEELQDFKNRFSF